MLCDLAALSYLNKNGVCSDVFVYKIIYLNSNHLLLNNVLLRIRDDNFKHIINCCSMCFDRRLTPLLTYTLAFQINIQKTYVNIEHRHTSMTNKNAFI